MECPYCGVNRKFLIKMPVVLETETEDGIVRTYNREGFDKSGKHDHICFECLKFEAEEIL